ncbi:transforming acidic coiled-coil-containing protein 2-like isoform X2 [Saccostrea echinata]|uniref:transforming acidic coiled-coil-containing protein 2-like isoform X2 n=1 Tax=Saccostrea echinata TaxID=191078 RepID=UPI002A8368EC|nr:transforming acidic coiled-coil-containing protein 2-like isoform X2 [Saccostrea echinata]
MEEEEIPLPASKGTYNIDFDNLDDFNPFQSSSKMGFSPPKTDSPLNPFQSRSKLRLSPPLSDCNENQIKSESVDSVTENSDVVNTVDTENQSVKGTKNQRSPEEGSPQGSKVDKNPIEMSDTSTQKEIPKKEASTKKATSPKKGIKKPKKFKPPANFGFQGGGDIEIFAPPPKNSNPSEDKQQAETIANEHDLPGSHDVEVTNQMTHSLEMVHEFGAGEMPEEDNEGFATAQAGIDEQSAWEMLDKYGTEEKCEDGEDKEFVHQEKTGEVDVHPSESSVDPEDIVNSSPSPLMTTPKAWTRVPKHPAARVLEENLEEHGGVRGSNKNNSDETDELKYYDAYEYPPKKDGKEMTEAKSPVDNNIVHLVQVLKYSQSDVNKIKQDLELDFQARLLNKEREWSQKLGARDKVITELQEQNKLYKATNEDMRAVVAEFEKTIAQLHTEKERSVNESQQTFEEVVKERDQALEDLQGVEASFSDLHRRYEKTKGVVEGFKKNEEVLKKCIQDYQSKLKVAEDKLQEFVQQAETKIDNANSEMERTRKTAASDIARLEAAVKKAELQVQSLQRSLDQKVKENEELTSICDELIAKVGS